MVKWTTEENPFGANHTPGLLGLASDGSGDMIPVAVNPVTGGVVVDTEGGGLPSTFTVGQATVNASAAQIDSSSVSLVNGVIVQAMSTNTVSIFVGGSGVSDSTGFELQPGQATSLAVNNINLIYAICSTTSQGICWIGS